MLPPILPLRRAVPPAPEARRRIEARRILRASKPRPVRRWLAAGVSPCYRTWGGALGFLLGFWIALELLLPVLGASG